ncbi:MAG TPA: hypothetical protein VKA19_13840 [Alphaproteobacteria bacterium]|nr:hypothetical protein [Alphaproteobacteria bacterium]
MKAVFGFDELRGDPHHIAVRPDAAFENVVDAERLANLPKVVVLSLEGEGRGSPGDLELRNARKNVEDFFRDAVREIALVVLGRHIDKGKNGHRGCLARIPGALPCARKEMFGDDHNGEEYEAGKDSVVELAAGFRRDAFFRGDVFRELNALRRHLEGPGEKERNRESRKHKNDEKRIGPAGQVERPFNRHDHLNEQPPDDGIDARYAKDITPLQLVEEFHHRPPLAFARTLTMKTPATTMTKSRNTAVHCWSFT